MEEDNLWDPNPKPKPQEDEQAVDKKTRTNMSIVGYNLLVLVCYTLLVNIAGGLGGMILDAFLLFIHVVVCIGVALGKQSWIWFLSALLVLVIGFSTCAMIGSHVRI